MRLAFLLGTLALAFPAWASPACAQGNPSFNLVNRSPQAISQVFATPAGVDRWGQDRLQQSYIPAGSRFPVRLPADSPCVYDVRVVYADGRVEERRRVDTCRLEAMAFPDGTGDQAAREPAPREQNGRDQNPRGPVNDPSFRLVNAGRSEINALYATLVGQESWGQDRLGEATVAVGGTFVVRLPPGRCGYDIKVVFANREIVERRRVDLCSIRDLRVP